MAEELTMPRLSDTMEEGTIARWLVKEGDEIHEGDVIAEIETDKATMEFQSYADGTVLKILVGDGESVALGAPIALVGAPGESADGGSDGGGQAAAGAEQEGAEAKADEAAADEGEAGEAEAQAEGEETPAEPSAREEAQPEQAAQASDGERGEGTEAGAERDEHQASDGERAAAPAAGDGRGATLRVTPIARRMADEAGIDLRALAGRGSGPEGRVVKVDVERLLRERGKAAPAAEKPAEPKPAPAPAAQPADAEVKDAPRILRAVARRMTEASHTVPHFYLTTEIDMGRALALRRELNEGLADSGEKISVNDLVLRACAMALMEHPQAHRSWLDGKLAYHRHANVGIAVALEDGLVVPVLREADRKGIRQIAREARDLATRARDGKLKQHEIEGGTFTVSNLGMFDVTAFDAIINPPEPGILAVGSVVERPVARDGEVAVASIMALTLAVDHRACSGADGARLLQTVKRLLQGGPLLLA
jgi:pyruvate dehydrogenase E2 component (dihydrolipoamide acetyltransferase)